MTEMVNAEVPESEQPQVVHEPESAVSVNDDDQKPVFNKYQVRDVVKREQQKAYEKGKREALMELQQQAQAPQDQQQPAVASAQAPQAPQQPQLAPTLGGMQQQQVTPDMIRQMIMETTPQALQAHARKLQQDNLVNSFVSKMHAAESKYPGMEQKLHELDYTTIHPLIEHIDKMENTGDIMHELLENPMKMGNLVSLLNAQPSMARKAIQDLSSSIKMNTDAASQEKSANDPFGQIKPSNHSGKDDGDLTVADFQKMFRKKK